MTEDALAQRLAEVDRRIAAMTIERAAIARALLAAEAAAEPIWIDTWTAAYRFGVPIDSVRWLARHKGMGHKSGGRWLIDAAAVRRYMRKRAR